MSNLHLASLPQVASDKEAGETTFDQDTCDQTLTVLLTVNFPMILITLGVKGGYERPSSH